MGLDQIIKDWLPKEICGVQLSIIGDDNRIWAHISSDILAVTLLGIIRDNYVDCLAYDYELYTLDHVEVSYGEEVTLYASDPRFFEKLERHITEHIKYRIAQGGRFTYEK